MCSFESAGWLGSRDLGFSNRDLGKWAENFAICGTLHHGYWNQSEMNSGGPDVVVLHGLLCFPRHTHPFNRSDTALRVAEAMVARKL